MELTIIRNIFFSISDIHVIFGEYNNTESMVNMFYSENKTNKYLLIGACLLVLILVLINQSREMKNIFEYGYFDANGTTWIHPKALSAYNRASLLGNASAGYANRARDIVQHAQRIVMERTWTNPDEYQIFFNSGASEANNLIIRAVAMSSGNVSSTVSTNNTGTPHIILSSIEHKTSIDCAMKLEKNGLIELSLIKPGIDSIIDPIDVAKEIKDNTRLISIMHINNETGAVNDIESIGSICKDANIFFHTDAVQSFGKMEIPIPKWNLDAISVSFHKLYGPQGVGCVVLSNKLAQVVYESGMGIAGSQWNGLRGGTVNTPGIAASLEAMKQTFHKRTAKNNHLIKLKETFIYEMTRAFPLVPYDKFAGRTDDYMFIRRFEKSSINTNENVRRFEKSLNNVGMVLLGPTRLGRPETAKSSPNVLLFALPLMYEHSKDDRICNIKLKKYIADRGFNISIGSACNTTSDEPSHVLEAIDAPFVIRSSVCRISMHDKTTISEIRKLVRLFKDAVQEQL